jgi:hypothetical protein
MPKESIGSDIFHQRWALSLSFSTAPRCLLSVSEGGKKREGVKYRVSKMLLKEATGGKQHARLRGVFRGREGDI